MLKKGKNALDTNVLYSVKLELLIFDIMDWLVWTLIAGVGVLQLPLIVDLVLALVPSSHKRIHRLAHRGLSYALICIVAFVSLVGIGYFFFVFFPRLTNWSIAQAVFITTAWALFLDNYLHCCLVRPNDKVLKDREVQGFDHYCPFTMNVVFSENYRYFFQFLFFGSISLSYACYLSWEPFYACWVEPLAATGRTKEFSEVHQAGCNEPAYISLVFTPAVVLFGAVFGLLVCQIWLFYINKTTALFFSDVRTFNLHHAVFCVNQTRPTKYQRYLSHWAGPLVLLWPPFLSDLFQRVQACNE